MMKKLLLLMMVLASTLTFAQTTIDLSGMTEDVRVGQNCSSSQTLEEFQTTGDVNLNGFELELRNATLIINGNLNGDGEIEGCGQSTICVSGSIQNDVEIENVNQVSCATLSSPTFGMELVYRYSKESKELFITDATSIAVYDLAGRRLLEVDGNTADLSVITANYILVKPELTNSKSTKAFKLLR